MKPTARSWVKAGLPRDSYDALTSGLPASRLWSLLLDVANARATRRRPAELVEQWDRDRFVQPALVDQRSLVEVDGHLSGATSAFESIELSPVAPLGVCAIMGHASQNKVLSALRGTELVSDPTNVMALECARRLRRDAGSDSAPGDLASLRPRAADSEAAWLTANFRIFCLASAGLERQNHAFVVDAMAEHIKTMLHALDQLEQHGFAFPERRITVLTTENRAALGDRIVASSEAQRSREPSSSIRTTTKACVFR